MRNNFLITAMGGSGTMFLANLMNQSKQWTVRHEPNGREPRPDPSEEVLKRFDQDFYGEVNSRLRWCAHKMPVKKLGIIIRNPYQHSVSLYNKNYKLTRQKHSAAGRILKPGELYDALRAIHRLELLNDAQVIRFEKMTTDHEYLSGVLTDFGITDVSVTQETVTRRRNVNQTRACRTWQELPADFKKLIEPQFKWFWEEYYAET